MLGALPPRRGVGRKGDAYLVATKLDGHFHDKQQLRHGFVVERVMVLDLGHELARRGVGAHDILRYPGMKVLLKDVSLHIFLPGVDAKVSPNAIRLIPVLHLFKRPSGSGCQNAGSRRC